jgi:hypothetical protein
MGLGDFLSGAANAVGGAVTDVVGAGVDIAEDVGSATKNVAKATGWAATHVDDAIKGVAEYGGEMAKGVGWLASHPGYWDDAAKQMVVDQFTDPVNIATNVGMLGLTIATGGAAAPAWMAKLGLSAKVAGETAAGLRVTKGLAETAELGATGAKLAKAGRSVEHLVEGAEDARKLSRLERVGARAEKIATKLDELQNKPTELIQRGRKAVTGKLEDVTGGLIKQRELSYVQQGRKAMATKAFGEAEDLKEAAGWGAAAKRYGYRTVAGGASKSELIEAGSFAELNWRANRTAGQIKGVRDFRENVQVKRDVVQAIAHPEEAGKELAQAAWHEYGDEATNLAWQHKGAIKKALGIGDEKKKEKAAEAPYEPYQQPAAEPLPGMMDFRLNNTRATKTSKRMPNQPAALGTVTKESTMPTQIGPSDWYGPQQGYKTGRGFTAKPISALPPLEQPRLGQRDTVGI